LYSKSRARRSDRCMEKTERDDYASSGALHRGANALTRRGVQSLE